MSKNTFILAPDLGNSWVKTYLQEGRFLAFPALVSPGRVIRYRYSVTAGTADAGYLDELTLKNDSGLHFVGYSALDKSTPEKIRLAHDQEQSLEVKKILLQTIMGVCLPQECYVKLLLGHPYADAHLASAYVKMALGDHTYNLCGQDYYHEVIEVQTISQVVAAFLGIVTGTDGKPLPQYKDLFAVPVMIIDIGGGTWDVTVIERNQRSGKLEVQDHLSGSERYGVWSALKLIQEAVYSEYGIEKSLVELENELYKQTPHGFIESNELILNGKVVDVRSIKEAAFAQNITDGMVFTTNKVPSSARAKIGRVFSVGGGTIRFEKYLLPHYRSLFEDRFEVVPAAQNLIALGQYNKAMRLWGTDNE